MKFEIKQRKETVMNRSMSLLACLLMGVALCGCQTTPQNVRLGACPLTVEVRAKDAPAFNEYAAVSINGKTMGTTDFAGQTPVRWGTFTIHLAPGTYQVIVTSKGYEDYKQTVSLVGNEHPAVLRTLLEPETKPAAQK